MWRVGTKLLMLFQHFTFSWHEAATKMFKFLRTALGHPSLNRHSAIWYNTMPEAVKAQPQTCVSRETDIERRGLERCPSTHSWLRGIAPFRRSSVVTIQGRGNFFSTRILHLTTSHATYEKYYGRSRYVRISQKVSFIFSGFRVFKTKRWHRGNMSQLPRAFSSAVCCFVRLTRANAFQLFHIPGNWGQGLSNLLPRKSYATLN